MTMVILTIVGPDRPGIVKHVSEQIAAHGGSWMESRLAHLAGQFAGMVLASVPDQAADPLATALGELAADGVRITLHRAAATPPPPAEAAIMLSLVCQDRTGIIRDITRVLAAAHVNIEELNTTVLNGSFSGEAMFQAEARLRLPAGFDIDDLRRDLERLENDLMVDVRPAEPVAEVV